MLFQMCLFLYKLYVVIGLLFMPPVIFYGAHPRLSILVLVGLSL